MSGDRLAAWHLTEDDGTDGARCSCGRAVPCRHCPEPVRGVVTRLLRRPNGEATPFAWLVMWVRGWER